MVQIFMIPVNEAFDATLEKPGLGCPMCKLYRELQENELDIILGASMMEPDIRKKTNELGFCGKHFGMMLSRKRMLGMGLILESHLASVKEILDARALLGDPSQPSVSGLTRLARDCYVCSRIDTNIDGMISTVAFLYEREDDFRKKLKAQPYFCIPHYTAILSYAAKKMNKRLYREFFSDMREVEEKYLAQLSGDVKWFCKKFDYRYDEEPWYNSRDSVQRSIKFLTGATDEDDK